MEEDLRQLIVATGAETRRHFDVVAEGLRQELGEIATSLREENSETRRQLSEIAASLGGENAETRRQLAGAAQSLREENAETRRQLAEVAQSLRQENADARGQLAEVAQSLRQENAEVRGQLADVAESLRQENKETQTQLGEIATSLWQEISATQQQLAQVAASLRQENSDTRQQLGTSVAELRQELRVATADLRLQFDITAERFQHEVELFAEGLTNTNDRVDLLGEEMRDRFAKAHAEMRLITEGVAQLHTRVVRLETKVNRQGDEMARRDDMARGFSETKAMIAAVQADQQGVNARLDQLEAR